MTGDFEYGVEGAEGYDPEEFRAYVEAEFTRLADAIERKDGAAALMVINRLGAEGDSRLAQWVQREILTTGLTRLAERAHDNRPGAVEDLVEALALLVGRPAPKDPPDGWDDPFPWEQP
jgi:hypothetical protein